MSRRPTPHARAALLEAGRAEMGRRGLRGARIEDITAAAGLSKGAFYLHFPSKESLFGALVRRFERAMELCSKSRRAVTEAFLASGPITRTDISRGSPRYRELLSLEEAEDLRTLELMWEYRDVVEVLISGAQGTPFEGSLWRVVEREAARVADDFRSQQAQGTCRTDVPPEVFGAMVVGTYLLLAHRLCRMRDKPDLRSWARSLQTLVHQGAAPGDIALVPAPAPPGASATRPRMARARAAQRPPPRSSP